MKIDTKILKTLENSVQEHIKKFHTPLSRSFQGCKNAYHMQISKYNIPHKQNQGQKSNDHLNRWRKRLWQNSTFLNYKSLKELEVEEKYLNVIKTIYDKSIANITLMAELPYDPSMPLEVIYPKKCKWING
jgi:hypothetical protein